MQVPIHWGTHMSTIFLVSTWQTTDCLITDAAKIIFYGFQCPLWRTIQTSQGSSGVGTQTTHFYVSLINTKWTKSTGSSLFWLLKLWRNSCSHWEQAGCRIAISFYICITLYLHSLLMNFVPMMYEPVQGGTRLLNVIKPSMNECRVQYIYSHAYNSGFFIVTTVFL